MSVMCTKPWGSSMIAVILWTRWVMPIFDLEWLHILTCTIKYQPEFSSMSKYRWNSQYIIPNLNNFISLFETVRKNNNAIIVYEFIYFIYTIYFYVYMFIIKFLIITNRVNYLPSRSLHPHLHGLTWARLRYCQYYWKLLTSKVTEDWRHYIVDSISQTSSSNTCNKNFLKNNIDFSSVQRLQFWNSIGNGFGWDESFRPALYYNTKLAGDNLILFVLFFHQYSFWSLRCFLSFSPKDLPSYLTLIKITCTN